MFFNRNKLSETKGHGKLRKTTVGVVSVLGLSAVLGAQQASVVSADDIADTTTVVSDTSSVQDESASVTDTSADTTSETTEATTPTQSDVDQAQQIAQAADEAVAAQQLVVDEAQATVDSDQAEVNADTQAVSEAQEVADKATDENIQQAKDDVASAQNTVSTNENAVSESQDNVTSASEAVQAQQEVVNTDTETVASAQESVDTAQADVATAQANLDGTGASTIIQNQATAQANQESAQSAKAQAETALTDAQNADSKLASDIATKTTEVSKKQAELTTSSKELAVAQTVATKTSAALSVAATEKKKAEAKTEVEEVSSAAQEDSTTVSSETAASANDDNEGYTSLRATEVPISGALSTEYENYNAAEWTMGEVMDTSTFPSTYFYKPTATKEAVGTITSASGKEITVTTTIESTNVSREDGAYLWRNNGMTMTQSMGVVADDVYAGNAAPADIPALGVIVYSPSIKATGLDPHDHLNYDGEVEVAQLTLTFSEEVTNPIIDFSGIGGFAATTQNFWRQPDESTTSLDDVQESYWRGSYTATKFELLTDGITLERVTEGRNITIYDGALEVAEKNTNNAGREAVVQGIQSAPSGTGTMQLTGTFSEVKFRLVYQVTPMSYYVEEGDGKKLNDGGGVRDGINGWNYIGDRSDQIILGNNSEVVNVTVGTRTGNNIAGGADEDTWLIGNRVPNADAFVISVRLVQTGDVLIDYVDTDGNSIKDQYIDTPVSPVDSKTPPYNTQENEEEYPSVIEVQGVPYTRVTEGDYVVGHVENDGHLSSTTQEWGTDEVSGEIEETTKRITYVYQPAGSVRVSYVGVDAEGQEIVVELQEDKTVETTVSSDIEIIENAAGDKYVAAGTAYDTTEEDTKPTTITRTYTDEDGNEVTETWRLVSVAGTNPHAETDGDAEVGQVESGVVKEVTYYYEKVVGDVVVNYYSVDEDGNVITDANDSNISIKPTVNFVEDGNIDEDYNTAEVRDDYIEFNGDTYRRVDIEGTNPHAYTDGDDEEGKVTEETQVINYYYEKVVGDVIVHYVNEAGETIAVDQVDTPEGTSIGTTANPTTYDTTDLKPVTLPVLDADGNPSTITVNVVDENGEQVLDEEGNPVTAEVDTYFLIPTATTGVRPDGSEADEQGNLVEGTTEITYVYKLPTVVQTKSTTEGNVIVHYIRESDNETIANDVEDEPATVVTTTTVTTVVAPDGTVVSTDEKVVNSGAEYDTAVDNKPNVIVFEDQTYALVRVQEGDVEQGTIVEGTTEVTYIYRLVTGDVIVNYYGLDYQGNDIFDGNGNNLAINPTVTVVEDGDVDQAYDTTDEAIKLSEIVYNGVTYRLVEADYANHVQTDGDAEQGAVEGDTTKVINYYYLPVVGDVIVHYIDTEGNTIAVDQVDTPEGTPTNTPYDTTDNGMKPATIEFEGNTYYFVEVKAGDEETGEVVEGTTEVTYIYALPTTTTTTTTVEGDVIVHYVDTAGNTIATDNVDEPNTVVSTTTVTTVMHPDGQTVISTTTNTEYSFAQYDSRDENAEGVNTKPETIEFEGKTYRYVEVKAGDKETGLIVEGTTEVTYIYELVVGEVVARYVIEGTEIEIAASTTVKEADTPVGETYEDQAPTTIVYDGHTYEYVEVRTNDGDAPATGEVVEGKQTITYEYKLVTGNVIVNYVGVDKDGNEVVVNLQDTVELKKDADIDEAYDATTVRPDQITDAAGNVWQLVSIKGTNPHAAVSGDETGTVKREDQEVIYYYELVGEVVARYVIEGTETEIADSTIVKEADTPVGEAYEDQAPTTIVYDGHTYEYVEVRTNDGDAPASGEVEPGKQTITYEYKLVTGNVVVHYIDEDGETIAVDVEDTPETSTGVAYDTTDNKPSRITTADGKVYELVPAKTIGEETGKVVEGTTEVTYVYREVKGNVEVHYHIVDKDGNVIVTDAIDFNGLVKDGSIGTNYSSIPVRYQTITVDGKTYRLVIELTNGTEEGSVTEETQIINYYYVEVEESEVPEEPTPEKPAKPDNNKPNRPAPKAAEEVKETPVYTEETLPNTGDASSVATGMVGLTSILSGLGLASRHNRRKK